ncbi:protein-L-isoaspartate(D-aspartate) O-methyltransferase [Tautonia plasticadhaerens]|uniref:Protein-L-isoaspartate O-methyltransferase n=1 Tax=Tautonia plasticadhaerens TaxID=2527974 RepID=A0A518H8D4_9BACT|nr:protein-L-isoaspartate(D-aspartate) O-methyltransferase [Tautonia plasticadhaerens]QDV37084.1 Protein-L-isoaspartate O-methyltransferase [Tautonia plasticadhaerens]
MPDPHDHPAEELCRQLRARGIHDDRVLGAIASVPRDRFVPASRRDAAWEDRALPIGCDQTISQPFMVALMTQELGLRGDERVLEIGTGSGYQTAILSALARAVFTVERLEPLSRDARGLLEGSIGCRNVHFLVGDGTLGWPEAAPYDRILVTAAAPELPSLLFEQLGEGGRLVVPIGSEQSQQLYVVERRGGEPVEHASVTCRFVPLVGERGWDGHPRGPG